MGDPLLVVYNKSIKGDEKLFNEEHFLAVGLHVVELPPILKDGLLFYQTYLKEIPTLVGEGFSKKEAYRQMTEAYALYRKENMQENPEESSGELENETTSNLSLEQLLRYYDGEVFDGFKVDLDQFDEEG